MVDQDLLNELLVLANQRTDTGPPVTYAHGARDVLRLVLGGWPEAAEKVRQLLLADPKRCLPFCGDGVGLREKGFRGPVGDDWP